MRCAQRYGDPFTVFVPMDPLVLTTSAEGVKTIFTADPET